MLIRTEKQLESLGIRLGQQIANRKWPISRRSRNKSRGLYAINHKISTTVVALVGELGSGKTTFVRGFARGLGIRSRITSPTFILARHHRIPTKKPFNIKRSTFHARYLWHLDLYRLRGQRDLAGIHFQELVEDPKNIVVIEWADKIKRAIPKNAQWIQFQHHKKGRTVLF